MKFLIDGVIIEAKGIYMNGRLITNGKKGSFSRFIKRSLKKLKKDFRDNLGAKMT